MSRAVELRCDYIDGAGVNCTHGYTVSDRSFGDDAWAELDRQAREYGWAIDPNSALCPQHRRLFEGGGMSEKGHALVQA